MKIQRVVNGQVMEFELTPDELYSAFEEKQHLFDIEDAKNQNSEPCPSLPETCYGILAGAGDVIIIKKGESGYYKTDIDAGSKEANIALVDSFNTTVGVTKAQRAAMEAGSMFGWHVPAANPEMYDEDGNLKRDSLSDKIQAADDAKAAVPCHDCGEREER